MFVHSLPEIILSSSSKDLYQIAMCNRARNKLLFHPYNKLKNWKQHSLKTFQRVITSHFIELSMKCNLVFYSKYRLAILNLISGNFLQFTKALIGLIHK